MRNNTGKTYQKQKRVFPIGMALAWAVLALFACSRREGPEASRTATGAAPQAATERAVAAQGVPTSADGYAAPSEPDGADLDRLTQTTPASCCACDTPDTPFDIEERRPNIERLDLKGLVEGESDTDLLAMASEMAESRPVAAMQLLGHILEETRDPGVRIDAADLFVELVAIFGDEEYVNKALQSYDDLADMYASGEAELDLARVEWLFNVMTKHHILLWMDESFSKELVDTIRLAAVSPVELTYADYFEAAYMLRQAEEGTENEFRALYQAIKERNAYGAYFAQEDHVHAVLSRDSESLGETFRRAARLQSQGNWQKNKDDWLEWIKLPMEERIR